MRNADMPAMPGQMLDPDLAKALRERRDDLGLSLQDVGRLSSMAPGLTKREHFAAMMMQGYLSCPDVSELTVVIAKASLLAADTLLEELERTT